jgi:Ser/Thr protein kinase RdoA (MazF antagonist)
VEVEQVTWDRARYARAAHLLGRLAVSPRVAERADVGSHRFHIRDYLEGRLRIQVFPMLRDEGIWHHPLVAGAFDPALRSRLLAAADRADEYVEELSALPFASSHGDACPNNLLVRPGDDGFVLIDYGFWAREPIGFDLAQLLVGDIQVGKRSSADLAELEDACVAAYVEGMRAEGSTIDASVVRRAHALQLLVFTGYSTLPWEHLGEEPTPELHALAAERAALARFSLDLVDATAGVGEPSLR